MRLFLSLLLIGCFSLGAQAAPVPEPSKLETKGKYATILEFETGKVLFEKEADARMATSSMSKVMTMYLVFEALEKGALALDQEVIVSNKSWSVKGSRMFLQLGQRVKIEDLMRGVIIQSGNDAATALSEAVSGSESSFAGMMNDKVRELKMTGTHFTNASGLPDPDHYSTAHDLAILTLALIRDFPKYYHYYSEKNFTFNNIKQGNRNPLLYRDIGVDGVKTGHTEDAGYGLISSALRDGRRLITVINGLSSMQERADETASLLDWGYREFDTYTLVNKEEVQGAAVVWLGVQKTVSVVAANNVRMTLARNARDQVRFEKIVMKDLEAPIRKGQEIGKIVVIGPDIEPVEVKLVANEDVARLGFFKALLAKFKRMLGRE